MSYDHTELECQIANTLLTTSSLGQAVIEVKELDGTVVLKGSVETEQQKLAIEALVREQAGVVEVINQILVSR